MGEEREESRRDGSSSVLREGGKKKSVLSFYNTRKYRIRLSVMTNVIPVVGKSRSNGGSPEIGDADVFIDSRRCHSER